jgi:hypothetical protein
MGWSFSCDPSFRRADQIAKFRRPETWGPNTKLLADRPVGNHYWAAVETKSGQKLVFLALMQGGGRNMGWGYKDMDEYAGPSYYDCPLALLDMTDEPTEGYAVEWRRKVREYHAVKKARPKYEAGMVVEYGGNRYRLERPAASRKGWYVCSLYEHEGRWLPGNDYRMRAHQLAESKILNKEVV